VPGSGEKLLDIGNDVYLDEQIRTDRNGQTQLIFLDRSRISVARDTEITLNRFIFDPTTRTGQVTASLGPGLIRATASPLCSRQGSAMQISVHSGTGRQTGVVQLRGGKTDASCPIVLMRVQPSGSATIIQLAGGVVQVTGTDGPPATIMRPGFTAGLSESGPAANEGVASQSTISEDVTELGGDKGSSGDKGSLSGDNSSLSGDKGVGTRLHAREMFSRQTSVFQTDAFLSGAFGQRNLLVSNSASLAAYTNVNPSILQQLEAPFAGVLGGLLRIPLDATITTLSGGKLQTFSIKLTSSGDLTAQPSLAALVSQLKVADSAAISIASLGIINRSVSLRH
jgi:hypothetical protein